LNFATDCWTSPNHRPYMAITVHMEVNGELLVMLLDFVEIARSHTGVALASEFVRILREFGIEHKVRASYYQYQQLLTKFKLLSVTCDNVSVNDTMIDKMEEMMEEFPGAASRTRCFDHILNLVAKTVIKCFDSPRKKAGEDIGNAEKELLELAGDADWEESYMEGLEKEGLDKEGTEEDNLEGWLNEEEFLSRDEYKTLKHDTLPIRAVLTKVQ
jgi:hypothetical protein